MMMKRHATVSYPTKKVVRPTSYRPGPPTELIALGKPDAARSIIDPPIPIRKSSTFHATSSTSPHHASVSPTIHENNTNYIDCPPHELVKRVVSSFADQETINGLICSAIRTLRANRSKPDQVTMYSLMLLARKEPSIFRSEAVAESLTSLLKKDIVQDYNKTKGHIAVAVLACNLLLAGFESDFNWPSMLVKAFVEDSVGDRMWVDHPQCEKFVMNISTAFDTVPIPSDQRCEAVEDNITSENGENGYPKRFTLAADLPRLYAVDILRERVARRQGTISVQDATGLTSGQHLLKTLTAMCGISEVRLLAAQKLEMWLQNPKLTKASQDLLLSICLNCRDHNQNDVDVIGQLTKIRFKSKALLSHYIHSLKALIDAHKDSITTLFNYVVYNELSNTRNPTNMSVMAGLMQHKPIAAAETLAVVCQDLLMQQEDFLRAVRALVREIIRQAKFEVHFSSFALGIMKAPDKEKFSALDQAHKERFIFSITDLVCLIMLASISPIIKDSISVIVKKQKPPSDANYESLYYSHKMEIAALQRDAVWWLHTTVIPTLLPRISGADFSTCLHKLLFLHQHDSYYMKDNWPPESDRNQMLRHCTEVPVLEDTILRLAVIGCSHSYPLVPADALDLISKLVKRAGLLGRPDFNPIPVERKELIDALLSLSQYHHPENIKLPSDYVPPSLAISVLYWSVWQTLLAICSFNPNSVGLLAWNEYPTLRNFMEMAIINNFTFPLATVMEEDKRSQIVNKELRMVEMEKNEILEFESHLAAATTQLSVNESSSLLLSQLIAMDTKGPLRRPPDHILSQVRNLCSQIQVGVNLCRSRNPDFLTSIIEGYGEDREMPWLSGLVGSARGDLNVLPVQCLCEFLMASNTDVERLSQEQDIIKQIQSNLQEKGSMESWQAINYFLRRLLSPQFDTRKRAKHAVSRILQFGDQEDMETESIDLMNSISSYKWLFRVLPSLNNYELMREKVVDAVMGAMKWDTDEEAHVAYLFFLAEDLSLLDISAEDTPQWASKYALSVAHVINHRQLLIADLFSKHKTSCSLAPLFVQSALKIMFTHLQLVKTSSSGNGHSEQSEEEIPWRDTQDEIFLRWPGMEHAQLHISVTQAMILLLTYGLPSKLANDSTFFDTADGLYLSLLNSWFEENGATIPKAYLMDTQEEAMLLPDWLRQRMLRCEITADTARLPLAACKDLSVEQLVVFIQSFGIPSITMDHLLLRLDEECNSSPETVRKVVQGNLTYLIKIVEGHWKRGCGSGTNFHGLLNVENSTARPSVIQSAAGTNADIVDLTMDQSEESDVVVISSPERSFKSVDVDEETPMQTDENMFNILQDIFMSSQSASEASKKRDSELFRMLLKSLTVKNGKDITSVTNCISEIQALVSAKKTGATFLTGLYDNALLTCTLLRKLKAPFRRFRRNENGAFDEGRKLFEKLTSTICSRKPIATAQDNQLSLLLQSWNVPAKQAEPNDEGLDWGRLEEFLRKQLAFLDKDAEIKNKVALVAQILLEEIGSRKGKMSRGKSDAQDDSFYASIASTGLLIDWLQLLDPELLAHRPDLQRKLLFESCRPAQTSMPIKISAKMNSAKFPQTMTSHQTYLLSLITEHSNWETVYKCLKWLLSDTVCDHVTSDRERDKAPSMIVDPCTAMDFFWVCMHVSKIWKGRENKSNCLREPIFYLSSEEFCHVLSYMVEANAKQANQILSKTGWGETSYIELFLIFYTKFGQREKLAENLDNTVKFIYSKTNQAASDIWWRLLAQIYIMEPFHKVWKLPISAHGQALQENNTLSDVVTSMEVGSICRTDLLTQKLLDRIGYVKESGHIDGREAVSAIQSDMGGAYDASLLLKKYASASPSIVLRQLSLILTELTGRTWYEFREFKAKNHLLFMSQLVGVLDAIGHDQLFSEEYAKDTDKIFETYFQALSNYATKARRQMRDVVYDTLKLAFVYLQKKPSRAFKIMSQHYHMLYMFMERTYSDYENIVSVVGKIIKFLDSVSYTESGSDGNPLQIETETSDTLDQTSQCLKLLTKNADLENSAQILSDLNDTKRKFFHLEPFLPHLTKLFMSCGDASVRHSALGTAVTCLQASPSKALPHIYPAYLSCLTGVKTPSMNVVTGNDTSSSRHESECCVLSDLCVDKNDIARTALDFLPEVSVLCREKAPELLEAAFSCGSRHGVGVTPPGAQGVVGTPLTVGGNPTWQDLSELIFKSLVLLRGLTQNNIKPAPI